MRFAGSFVFDGLAFVEEDPHKAWAFIAQSEALLETRSVGLHALIHIHDSIELGLRLGDHDAVERYARVMEELTREEPLPWAELVIARARALARYGRGSLGKIADVDASTRAELRRVYDETARLGLRTLAHALAEALAAVGESPYNAKN